MTVHIFKLVGAGVLSASLLAACGGGGSDVPAAPSTPATSTFALKAGYKARIDNGTMDNFNVSGTCSGTLTTKTKPAVLSTFEGVTGYASEQVSTLILTNCSPATSSDTGTTYYNANYVPIGLSVVGGEHARFASPSSDFPASVKVGDSAVVATLTTFTDSTYLIANGKRVVSYAIEPDTSTTAIANITTRLYDLGGALLTTEQSRYHMAEDGALTLASIDVQSQFNTTSPIHLVYTPK